MTPKALKAGMLHYTNRQGDPLNVIDTRSRHSVIRVHGPSGPFGSVPRFSRKFGFQNTETEICIQNR
jgi:hypothetical protein